MGTLRPFIHETDIIPRDGIIMLLDDIDKVIVIRDPKEIIIEMDDYPETHYLED